MTETRIDLPGLPLAAVIHGADDAPPLLALHGWLDNAASFDALAPHLAECRRVIALDLPGHGRSAHLPAGRGSHYHFIDYVDLVLTAAEALHLGRFDLLGHSLGAGVASLVAAAAPERIRHLALIEGLGPLADDSEHTLQRFRRAMRQRQNGLHKRRRVFADVDSAVRARTMVSDLAPDEARAIVTRGLEHTDGGYRWSSDPRQTLTTPIRLPEAQVRRLLAGIEAPTQLLLAEPHTPYLPPDIMRARAACVADIRLAYLEGHHHLHVQHPGAVAEQLLPFLSKSA